MNIEMRVEKHFWVYHLLLESESIHKTTIFSKTTSERLKLSYMTLEISD